MAMVATLTFDDTTINLMTGGCVVEDGFRPATASAEDDYAVDELRLHFIGTNANARALNQNINKLLDIARSMQDLRGGNEFVHFNWAINGSETVYRARVGDGQTDLHEAITRFWRNGRAKFTLRLERAPFWEGPLSSNIPITNSNGTRQNSLPIYPCADGSGSAGGIHENYVKIQTNDLSGDMPGAAMIWLEQSNNVMDGYIWNPINKLFIGNFVDIYGTGRPLSDIETFSGAGSPTSQALASGGSYYAITLPTSANLVDALAYASYSDVAKLRGSWFRFFLRTYGAAPDGTWVRVFARLNGTQYVGETPWVRLDTSGEVAGDTRCYDLGLMRMPPYLYPATYPTLTLNLHGWRAAGGTLNLDALQMFGVDYYAELGMGNKTTMIDFSATSESIVINEGWGTLDKSIVTIYDPPSYYDGQIFTQRLGSGIYLTPGKDNYLHFMMRAPNDPYTTEGTPRSAESIVYLKYRPRRRNL